jgi:hypothetical protein
MHVWCRWCRIDTYGSIYDHSFGSSLDTRSSKKPPPNGIWILLFGHLILNESFELPLLLLFAGETRQAEDRIRRIGQMKPCTSYWMRSFELDRQIDDVLASKNQTTSAVLHKNTSLSSGVVAGPAAKISISKLARSFLLSSSRGLNYNRNST